MTTARLLQRHGRLLWQTLQSETLFCHSQIVRKGSVKPDTCSAINRLPHQRRTESCISSYYALGLDKVHDDGDGARLWCARIQGGKKLQANLWDTINDT